MKKFIIALTLLVFVTGTAYAVKVRTLNATKITKIVITVKWDRGMTAIEDATITANGIVLDDIGKRAGDSRVSYGYNSLPANAKTSVATLIKLAGKAMSNQYVDEDVEPVVPDTMP